MYNGIDIYFLCFIVHYPVVVKVLETRTSVPTPLVEREGEQTNWKPSSHRLTTRTAADRRTLTPATSAENLPDRSQTVLLKLKNFLLDYKIDHQELCCDVPHLLFFPLNFFVCMTLSYCNESVRIILSCLIAIDYYNIFFCVHVLAF